MYSRRLIATGIAVLVLGGTLLLLVRMGSQPAKTIRLSFSERSTFHPQDTSFKPKSLSADDVKLLNRLFSDMKQIRELTHVDMLGTLTGEINGTAVAVEIIAIGKRPLLCKIGNEYFSRVGEYVSTSNKHEIYIDESQALHGLLTTSDADNKSFSELLLRSAFGAEKLVSITGRVTMPSDTEKMLAADAIVYLAATDAIPPQTDLVAITAKVKGGRLLPEQIDLIVGQKLVVDIEGKEPYSLHVHSSQEPEFGRTLPMNMARWEKTFTKPTMLASVTCDIHPTFRGMVTVMPNRAFVRTLKDGSFALSVALPPGKYDIHAFLIDHGRSSGSIEVKAGQIATIDFHLPH